MDIDKKLSKQDKIAAAITAVAAGVTTVGMLDLYGRHLDKKIDILTFEMDKLVDAIIQHGLNQK